MNHPVVLRVKPLKSLENLKGSTNHNQRRANLTDSNIDSKRDHLNQVLFGSADVESDAAKMLSKYKLAHSKGTPFAEMILTANADYFDKISPDWKKGIYTREFHNWIESNIQFLKAEYPGLINVTLHMDETSPHLHCVIAPVAKYQINFRRGSKDVERIHYNHVFGDDASVISKARITQDSELTKLGQLQTKYADAMSHLGLTRGVKNSKSINITPSEFRQKMSETHLDLPIVTTDKVKLGIKDYAKMAVGSDTDKSKLFKLRHEELENFYETAMEILPSYQAKSLAHDILKPRLEDSVDLNREKDLIITKLKSDLENITKEHGLTKLQIDSLRKSPMLDIAQSIGYTGGITWRNAIDMLKDIGDLDYKNSVAWLAHHFGKDVAKGAIVQNAYHTSDIALSNTSVIQKTKHEVKTAGIICKQLDALRADKYRVTLSVSSDAIQEEGEKVLRTYNLGKGAGVDGSEVFYSRDDIVSKIPLLSRENARGYNVFITPLSDSYTYMLIDDMTDKTHSDLISSGYCLSTLTRTSPKSLQGVITLRNTDVGSELSSGVRNAVFAELNANFGDANIQGQIHPLRLAGFTNRKEKHKDITTGNYPFVTLEHYARNTCAKTAELAKVITNYTSLKKAPTRDISSKYLDSIIEVRSANHDSGSPIPAIIANDAIKFYRWVRMRYTDAINMSSADWMLAKRFESRGIDKSMIAKVLLAYSPDIENRHSNAIEYAHKTAFKPK